MKIFGRGPRILLEAYVKTYLKYETSSRSFKQLPSKSITSTTDGVCVDASKIKKLQLQGK
jgi:hypothetical protein